MVAEFADAYLFRVLEKSNLQQFQENLIRLNDWIMTHRLNSGQIIIKSSPKKKKIPNFRHQMVVSKLTITTQEQNFEVMTNCSKIHLLSAQ